MTTLQCKTKRFASTLTTSTHISTFVDHCRSCLSVTIERAAAVASSEATELKSSTLERSNAGSDRLSSRHGTVPLCLPVERYLLCWRCLSLSRGTCGGTSGESAGGASVGGTSSRSSVKCLPPQRGIWITQCLPRLPTAYLPMYMYLLRPAAVPATAASNFWKKATSN